MLEGDANAPSSAMQTKNEQIIQIAAIVLLVVGCMVVLRPFLAGILSAAIDGIKNRIDPGDPSDSAISDAPAAPVHLAEALDALEQDHAFMLEGGVFTEDVIHYWIKYKRENEVAQLRARPHPYEFCIYFDI